MEDFFRLTGRVLDNTNNQVPELFLAIVDEDMLDADDLLGVGLTDADGRFSISFLGSEFRQDMFEDEATPDIKIIASQMFGDIRKAIFQKRFSDTIWTHNEIDLGDIVMKGVHLASPIPLKGVEPIPSYNRRAKRLNIDNEMVAYCLAEVAPIVEYLTGWGNLLDGIKVEIADSLAPYMLRESLVAAGTAPDSIEAKFSAFFADFVQGPGAGCALYDPHIHSIIINRKIMSQVGIEGLKIICGHELVHVGQYKYTKGLKEYNLKHLRGMSLNPDNVNPAELEAKGAYMIELEGYAKYIENDFLKKKHYPLAFMTYHASVLEKLIRGLIAMAMKGTNEHREAKASQYTDGLAIYRKRQVGDQPARFQLDVGTLPGGKLLIEECES